ncbi:nitrous oxide reductase family maturation protein NosD [Neisseriaceae bacterium B1]
MKNKHIITFLLLVFNSLHAIAAVIKVSPSDNLQAAIDAAQSGDTIQLAAGKYQTKILITKPLTLKGMPDHSAIIEGDRTGRTLTISAPDVTVKNLTVTRSGMSLPEMDAGIFLDKTATRAQVLDNHILDNSVGVYMWGAAESLVQGNTIVGNKQLRVNERGNGVTVWNSPNAKVLHNDISYGRDGIFSNASNFNTFNHNTFHKLRYGVHYMYTNDSEISHNISYDNTIGYAIMFSERIKVNHNVSWNNIEQGIMLNYANHSEIIGNAVDKSEKCVFIYNANHNKLTHNHFANCAMGIHFTAAPEGMVVQQNSFINNQLQIKYVGTRFLDWAEGGLGNYWSDNSAFDLNGDGIADTAYKPNGIIDQIVWRAHAARLLVNSPAVSIVKWAQQQFPAIMPGGIVDSKPLMKQPESETVQKLQQLKS